MSIIRTISSRQAERGRMSGGGSLWHTEQRALTSSSVATGCDDALVGPDPEGGAGDCWSEGVPVLLAWSTPPNRMAAVRSQPDGRRKGFTIRVYATGRSSLPARVPARVPAHVPARVPARLPDGVPDTRRDTQGKP